MNGPSATRTLGVIKSLGFSHVLSIPDSESAPLHGRSTPIPTST